MSLARELSKLQCLSEQQTRASTLNIEMRQTLHQHAAARGLKLEQDCVGNVYLSRPARDPTLANIALAFPIDAHDSPRLLTDTFLAFDRLNQEDVLCGVALMGFTSLYGEDVGLEFWENATTLGLPAALFGMSLFDQFSKFPSPTIFPFSAIFQISESPEVPLSISGSSILAAKTQKFVKGREDVRVSTQEFRRAPRLKIEGPGAEEVTRKILGAYSEYIVALFDNFD